MVIPGPGMRDETVISLVDSLVGRLWAIFVEQTRLDAADPTGWTDPTSTQEKTEPCKNQAKWSTPRKRPDWASFRSDVTMVAPDGILRQRRWLPTPKRPPEVTVMVVRRKGSRVNPICKENHK
ncbi:hypothetical protein CRG98_022381 [Punica granatum]|uniref:Uncharacterized protein n=1 Tax=Punica granatum TaxID=22663 RepID=A0A2I0JNY4_PUNGR|nr:hypothetical protein CRG98_022381 [Punica granatum]